MTTETLTQSARVDAILAKWGTDLAGTPTADTWNAIKELSEDQPLTLVNFFKMREQSEYPEGAEDIARDITGQEAFQRYADVSMPALESAGGRFLMVAPFGRTFVGQPQDWDLVAIGNYPNPSALLSLFEQDDYRKAYVHRTAACADQAVSLCIG
ncbi:MAG: DUF1330 domain-containing protein [Pseudomonadota bacterium]|nr:DUF1330 domain-containing protein [Pseudomonadota bacterium]